MLTKTPPPPYVAVIFTSLRSSFDEAGYHHTAERMVALAAQQPGFLGLDSARGADGVGITVGYFRDDEAVAQWRAHPEHQTAQSQGRAAWYQHYEVRVARVERAYGMGGTR